MGVNSPPAGSASLDRLGVPTTIPQVANTSPPIGTTTISGRTTGQGSEKSLEPNVLGVTAVPPISLIAAGGELLLVVRGRGDEEHTFPVLCFRRLEAKAKEERRRMLGSCWLWQLAGRVRAALLWCLGGVTNGPKEVRVRVDVVVTRRVELGPPPEVKVRVEPLSIPPPVLMLPPEVRVKVEGPSTPNTPGSTETAPPAT